jgi:hypothetical protein
MRTAFAVVLGLMLLGLASVALAQPTVFWASDPVRPNEAVVVVGDSFGDNAQVAVARLADGDAGSPPAKPPSAGPGVSAPPIQASAGSLKFVLPATLKPGLFSFTVTTPAGKANVLLNRPVVWWVQGDGGTSASPGGWVRAFGKNLDNASGLPVTIVLTGPKTVRLKATGDGFALKADLPRDLPDGVYRLFAHNGYGGPAGWAEAVTIAVRRAVPWPAKQYNVMDFGATGRGQVDDSQAVQAALVAIDKAGGGVLFFPRGQYQLTQTLDIPRHVVLRGESRDHVSIFWPDVAEPLPAQIKGTDSFGIEDLTFYCSNYSRFLVGDAGPKAAGNIKLRRVTVRADRYRGHMTEDEADRRLRKPGGNQTPLLSLGGPDCVITGCDLYSSGMVFWLSCLRGGLVADNILTNGRWGWYCLSCSDGVIFENNRIVGGDLMATGGGLNFFGGTPYSQHVYYAHNTLTNMFGWDREAMTSDGGGAAYYGKVVSATGATVTVAADVRDGGNWVNGALFILDGRGAGQYRRVVSAAGREIVVDRPWLVPPDATSTVTCCAFQGQCLFLGNDFTDAGVALQFYGNAIEHICAGNRSTRTAGFHNFGMNYADGIQPCWYLQWLDNEILEGNVYRGDHDNWRLAGEAHIGVYAFPPRADWDVPLTLATIVRRNHLRNNAHIMLGREWSGSGDGQVARYVRDVLVENNAVENADMGIFAFATIEGLALRGNTFTNVRSPLGGAGLAKAYVTPAERETGLRGSLQSLVAGLGISEDPGKWPEVAQIIKTAGTPAGAQDPAKLQGQALRATLIRIAKARPGGFPLPALAPTMGLSVRMPWECTAHGRLQNNPEGGPANLDLVVTASTPLGDPVPVSAEAKVPEGWKTDPSAPADLSDKSPAKLSIPLVIPAGEWSAHDFPVTLSFKLGDQTLRLSTTITAGSGYLRKWMVLGPFANRTGAALDLTLLPPDDGIDLDGEYDGLAGKIKWVPWEDGDWINFKDMYKPAKPAVAYAVACVNSPREMPAELWFGCSGGTALSVNGDPVWSSTRVHQAGPSQEHAPVKLRQGDNVIVFKLCSAPDEWTFVCNLTPARGGPVLTGVSVVSPSQFKGRACFAPPKKSATPTGAPQHTAGVDWKLVWADDFDRDNLGGRWRVGTGTWTVNGGLLQARGIAFLSYAEKLPAPVRIEYDTRVPGGTGGDLSACWLAKPDDFTSGCLIGFGSNGNTANKIVLGGSDVTNAPGPLVQRGKWHHVIAQILASGRVQLIVDDQMSLDFAGPAPGEPKYPGLWSWQSDGVFSKVRIYTGGQ